jgi:hypothetical protein
VLTSARQAEVAPAHPLHLLPLLLEQVALHRDTVQLRNGLHEQSLSLCERVRGRLNVCEGEEASESGRRGLSGGVETRSVNRGATVASVVGGEWLSDARGAAAALVTVGKRGKFGR